MSRILVLYGTTDGHTANIARAIGSTLRAQGTYVDIIEAGSALARPDDYSGIVIAASVHAGGYQRAVKRWVRTHAHDLDTKPTAFVSVCLAVLQKDAKVQRELKAIIEGFLTTTRWQPTTTKTVAGALLYTRYNWLKRWIMKRIVAKAGGDTDTRRDYEYTDWDDLRAFVERFAQLVNERKMSGDGSGFRRGAQVA
jgi:menaquinone-dependent protoporphyrinogen oxidase